MYNLIICCLNGVGMGIGTIILALIKDVNMHEAVHLCFFQVFSCTVCGISLMFIKGVDD